MRLQTGWLPRQISFLYEIIEVCERTEARCEVEKRHYRTEPSLKGSGRRLWTVTPLNGHESTVAKVRYRYRRQRLFAVNPVSNVVWAKLRVERRFSGADVVEAL